MSTKLKYCFNCKSYMGNKIMSLATKCLIRHNEIINGDSGLSSSIYPPAYRTTFGDVNEINEHNWCPNYEYGDNAEHDCIECKYLISEGGILNCSHLDVCMDRNGSKIDTTINLNPLVSLCPLFTKGHNNA